MFITQHQSRFAREAKVEPEQEKEQDTRECWSLNIQNLQFNDETSVESIESYQSDLEAVLSSSNSVNIIHEVSDENL